MAVEVGQTKKMFLFRHTDATFQGCFHQFCMEPNTAYVLRAYLHSLGVRVSKQDIRLLLWARRHVHFVDLDLVPWF